MVRRILTAVLIAALFPTWGGADDIDDLVVQLREGDEVARFDAARALMRQGANAERAIVPLVGALGDWGVPSEFKVQYFGPRVCDAAEAALVRIGQPAVPALIEALKDKNGQDDPPLLDDEDQEWLQDYDAKDDAVARRAHAARVLRRLGPLAIKALPDLTSALQDHSDFVRDEAIMAISRLGAPPKHAVQLLVDASSNDYNRVTVIRALRDADPDGTMAIPILIETLSDPDGDIVYCAASTLGRYGDKARVAIPALRKQLLTDSLRWDAMAHVGFQVPVRGDIAEALARLAPVDPEIAASLQDLMEFDNDPVARLWAAAALARSASDPLGVEAPMNHLRAAIRENDRVAEKAALALSVVGSDAAMTVLIRAVQNKEPPLAARRHAVEALGELGQDAAAAVPTLREALRDAVTDNLEASWLRTSIVRTLGKIGPAARPAVPDLLNCPRDESDLNGKVLADDIDDAVLGITGGKQTP